MNSDKNKNYTNKSIYLRFIFGFKLQIVREIVVVIHIWWEFNIILLGLHMRKIKQKEKKNNILFHRRLIQAMIIVQLKNECKKKNCKLLFNPNKPTFAAQYNAMQLILIIMLLYFDLQIHLVVAQLNLFLFFIKCLYYVECRMLMALFSTFKLSIKSKIVLFVSHDYCIHIQSFIYYA